MIEIRAFIYKAKITNKLPATNQRKIFVRFNIFNMVKETEVCFLIFVVYLYFEISIFIYFTVLFLPLKVRSIKHQLLTILVTCKKHKLNTVLLLIWIAN